jgi:hypothetical protein
MIHCAITALSMLLIGGRAMWHIVLTEGIATFVIKRAVS